MSDHIVGTNDVILKNLHSYNTQNSKSRNIFSSTPLISLLFIALALTACSKPNGTMEDPTQERQTPAQDAVVTCAQDSQCGDSKFCFKQTICLTEDEICTRLNCDNQPGICDAKQGRCVQADPGNCQKDGDCDTGNYCDIFSGNCKANTCEINAQGARCAGGGECVNGECQNKSECTDANSCISHFRCVKPEGAQTGQCRQQADLCAGQCKGNQKCTYDENNFTAKCEVSEAGCSTSVDCKGLGQGGADLMCNNHLCLTPDEIAKINTCQADSFEPSNNNESTATEYNKTSKEFAKLTLCNNDTDWYKFNTDIFPETTNRKLVIVASIAPQDFGRKNITMTIKDPNSNETVITSNNISDGNELKAKFDTIVAGEWFIKIEGISISQDIPVNYKLAVDVVEDNKLSQCDNAPVLEHDKRTEEKEFTISGLFPNNCGLKNNQIASGIHKLQVRERSHVEISANTTNVNTNISLAIKNACDTETAVLGEISCVNKYTLPPTQTETISQILEPGTYYVVVTREAFSGNDAGKYYITTKVTPTKCTPQLNKCDPNDNQYFLECRQDYTGYNRIECPNGCDTETNVCRLSTGDSCKYAIEIDGNNHIDTSVGFTDKSKHFYKTYQLTSLNNKNTATCGALTEEKTSGKDVVFKIKIPAKKALYGKVIGHKSGVAAYITESCTGGVVDTCLSSGSSHTREVVILYDNNSDQEKEVFLITDDKNSNSPAENVTLDLTFYETQCIPGDQKCENSAIRTCDSLGLNWVTSIQCSAGCKPDPKPHCNPNKNATCDSTEQLEANLTKQDQNNKFNETNYTLPISYCGFNSYEYGDDGPTAVYKFTTKPKHLYTVEVTPKNPSHKPMLWLTKADKCAGTNIPDPSDCIEGSKKLTGVAATLNLYSETTEEYAVFVKLRDGNAKAEGEFSIGLAEKKAETPFSTGVCNSTGDSIKHYDKYGQAQEYRCSCTAGEKTCTNANTETCMSAELLYDGTTKTTTSGTVSDIKLHDKSNGIYIPGFTDTITDECFLPPSKPKYQDRFYRFVLAENQILTIDYKDAGWEAVAFIQQGEHCGSPKHCKSSKFGRGSAPLTYLSTKANDEVFLVIKAIKQATTSPHPISFNWKIEAVPSSSPIPSSSCTIGTSYCNGNKVIACSTTGVLKEYTCAGGCSNGACVLKDANKPEPSGKGDTCNEAIDVGKGGVFIVDTTSFTNNKNPLCVNKQSEAEDIFFKITANKGEVITAYVQSLFERNANTYILKDCNNNNDSCVASEMGRFYNGNEKTEGKALAIHVADEPGSYVIGVDAFSKAQVGNFYVIIDVSQKTALCKGAGQSCSSGTLSYCERGAEYSQQCGADGCDSNNTHCKTPSGNICADAIKLTATSDYQELTDTVNSRVSHDHLQVTSRRNGGCIFGNSPSGAEKYYAFELKEGEQLDIGHTYISEQDYNKHIAYIMEGCSGAGGTERKCLATIPDWVERGNKERWIHFEAPKDGTYYYVIDRIKYYNEEGKEFKIKYRKTSKADRPEICIPFTSTCKDANTIKSCTSNGQFVEATCPYGCEEGLCKVDLTKNNSCNTVENDVQNGFAAFIPLTELTNNSSMTGALGNACLTHKHYNYTRETPSPEAFFRVDLKPNETVRVYTDSYIFGSNPAVYFFTSCGSGESEIAKSCLLGDYNDATGFYGPIKYTNQDTQNQQIFIAFDELKQYGNDGSKSYIARIEVDKPECEPTNKPPTCSTDKILQYCEAVYKNNFQYKCTHGCTDNKCTSPSGERCEEAIPLTIAAGSTTLTQNSPTTKTQSNNYDLGATSSPTGRPTHGYDTVYSITVPNNKKLKVKVKSTANPIEDLALYITDSCAYSKPGTAVTLQPLVAKDTNLDPSAAEEVEEVELTNDSGNDRLYYIYVDSNQQLANQSFELTVTLEDVTGP